MTAVLAVSVLLLGIAAGYALCWASAKLVVASARTDLNQARAHESLLLTRLASRTPAEFHAVSATPDPAAFVADSNRYLYDPTGLVEVVEDGEG